MIIMITEREPNTDAKSDIVLDDLNQQGIVVVFNCVLFDDLRV